jgi:hypothetical protein
MKEKDLTPSIVESGIESAKNFLSQVVTPPLEETGLLIKDQITLWRFKNQVKMINKAKAYCEKNRINPKAISLKLLVPLLDYSGCEEDEFLQDKWAILLSNLVDSEQNIENHVFPYILSQLSRSEFDTLEMAFNEKRKRVKNLQEELEIFRQERPQKELDINKRIVEIDTELKISKTTTFSDLSIKLTKERHELERQLRMNTYHEDTIKHKINKSETLPSLALKDFEESNLTRLGLIKEVKEYYANTQTLNIPLEPRDRFDESPSVNVDLDIDMDSNTEIIVTQLGELFICACKEKQHKSL